MIVKKTKETEVISTTERVIRFFEKDRGGIPLAFAVVFSFAIIRSVLECKVFEYASESLYLRANHVALYFGLFMTGVLIIKIASGLNGRKVFNLVLSGWWIIITPPILDYLLGYGGLGRGYPYSSNPNIIIWMMDAFNIAFIRSIGYGEFFQLYSIIVLSSLYVFLRTKSIFRSFLTGTLLFVFISYVAVSLVWLINFESVGNGTDLVIFGYLHFPIYVKYYSNIEPNMASFLIQQQMFLFVALYYTIMFLISTSLFMYIYSRERTVYFFKSIKWTRILLVVFAVYLGVFVSGALYPEYFLHEVYIGFAILAAASAAQFWNMMEDLTGDRPWNAPYTKKQYRNVALIFLILSIASSYLLGQGPFIMTILFLFTAYIYTSKPFEGKKTSLSSFIFGLYGVAAFLIGFYTPSYWLVKIWGKHIHDYDPTLLQTIRIPVPHPVTSMSIISLILVYILFLTLSIFWKRKVEEEKR